MTTEEMTPEEQKIWDKAVNRCCEIVGKDCPFCHGTGVSTHPDIENCQCPARDIRLEINDDLEIDDD